MVEAHVPPVMPATPALRAMRALRALGGALCVLIYRRDRVAC
jgi:hypothetical protein